MAGIKRVEGTVTIKTTDPYYGRGADHDCFNSKCAWSYDCLMHVQNKKWDGLPTFFNLMFLDPHGASRNPGHFLDCYIGNHLDYRFVSTGNDYLSRYARIINYISNAEGRVVISQADSRYRENMKNFKGDG